MTDPSYALELLMEIMRTDPLVQVAKVQPPDGCVIRDITGKEYGVSIYALEHE